MVRLDMDDCREEKKAALRDLAKALQELCSKTDLPLRDKAVVLQAIEKLREEKYDQAKP